MILTDHPLAADLEQILSNTEAVWQDLDGARLLITGGTGFFGSWLLESLTWARRRTSRGPRVIVLSRNPETFRARMPTLAAESCIEWVRGDVRQVPPAAIQADAVIHAATDTDAKRNDADPMSMMGTIVNGTQHMLEAALSGNAKRFLLISSGAVYGKQPAELPRIAETFKGAPSLTDVNSGSLYGECKRLAEMMASHFHSRHGLPVITARCFAFLGPHLPLDTHFAAGNFLLDAHLGRDINILGDGRPVRSYMYPTDLMIWLWNILTRGNPGQAYNVGSDDPVSIASLARRIAALAASHPTVKVLGQPGIGAPEQYVPDTSRARFELGLETSVTLDQAIRSTLDWLRQMRQ